MIRDSLKDLYKSHRTHRHTWASPDTGSGKTLGIEVIIFFCLWAARFIMQVPFLLSADQFLCSLNHKEGNLGSAPPISTSKSTASVSESLQIAENLVSFPCLLQPFTLPEKLGCVELVFQQGS